MFYTTTLAFFGLVIFFLVYLIVGFIEELNVRFDHFIDTYDGTRDMYDVLNTARQSTRDIDSLSTDIVCNL